ncbi:ATP-binding cassette sub-family C member 4-like isoform X1 [Styela clava]
MTHSCKEIRRNLRKATCLNLNHQTNRLNFAKIWNEIGKEKWKRSSGSKKPSLFTAMAHTYWKRVLVSGLFLVIVDSLRTGLPFLIAGLVSYFENQDSVDAWQAYAYAAAISLVSIVIAFMHHTLFYQLQRLGWHIRTSIRCIMYKKTLLLSQQSLNKTTTGKIVNLSSNDVMRFEYSPQAIHYIWIGPMQCIVIGIILWQEVGAAILTGIALLVLTFCVQSLIGRSLGKLRSVIAHLTDDRIRLVSEIITGMRVIKMYAWENPFAKLVSDARKKEVNKIFLSSFIRAFNICVSLCQDKILTLGILLTYVEMEGTLTASKVFAIIGILRFQGHVAYKFGVGIELLFETKTSIKRIEDYLMMGEISRSSNRRNSIQQLGKHEEALIEIKNFFGKWDASIQNNAENDNAELLHNTLSNITVRIEAKQLFMVIGQVASGKSSFLNAILGELPPTKGKVKVLGKSVYVGQVPWIFSGTIRENILFGQPYDSIWYSKVIGACCLNKDLSSLVDGDLTLVGERGVILSGGQKARVNLARAAYRRDADIFLLDDPLSSVDVSVARHIFQYCIMGILNNKLRILVTHQMHLLKRADGIMVLSKGKVSRKGNYSKLESEGFDFAPHLAMKETTYRSLLNDSIENVNIGEAIKMPHARVNRNKPFSSLGSYNRNSMGGSVQTKRRASLMISFQPKQNNSNQDMHRDSIISSIEIPDMTKFQAIESEKVKQGDVEGKVYIEYFRSGASVILMAIFILVVLAGHVIYIMTDWWLSYWISKHKDIFTPATSNTSQPTTAANGTKLSTDSTKIENFDIELYKNVYIGFVVGTVLILLLQINMHFYICTKSAFNMHKKMFQSLLIAPIRFFDINPAGRILNRFSKDIGLIDERLPVVFHDFIFMLFLLVSVVVMVTIINYFVIIIVIPLVIYFLWLRRYYLKTSRDIKRLEGICQSPIFSLLSSTLQGLPTIRSHGAQNQFENRFNEYQDVHGASWFLFLVCSRWFGLRLDLITAVFVSSVAFMCVIASSVLGLNAGQVGLILTYSVSMTHMFQFGVRQSAEVENLMTSVERILQYSNIPSETDIIIPPETHQKNWPISGAIRFENVSFAYHEYGPTVLKDVDFEIYDKEKVGVVGRTGAGKSSLISALLRLAVMRDGKIYIGGECINTLKLSVLRSAICIIPQDPMLFSGSLRKNIDPFSQYSDKDIWKALEQVQLKDQIESFPMKLMKELAEFGSNFSAGQRQLVCLARAVLKKSKILVIDEATANVDVETDRMIQETLRQTFKHCTIITIAHRINTVIDSDKILVLDQGQVQEFGEPHLLLKNKDGHLSNMLHSCGFTQSRMLRITAKEVYDKKHRVSGDCDCRRVPVATCSNNLQEDGQINTPDTP